MTGPETVRGVNVSSGRAFCATGPSSAAEGAETILFSALAWGVEARIARLSGKRSCDRADNPGLARVASPPIDAISSPLTFPRVENPDMTNAGRHDGSTGAGCAGLAARAPALRTRSR